MSIPRSVRLLLAGMLLVGCGRSAISMAFPSMTAQQFFDMQPQFVPDLATASTAELCTLPSIGAGRALAIQAGRVQVGPPWTAKRLALIPGLGEVRAAQLANALAVQSLDPD